MWARQGKQWSGPALLALTAILSSPSIAVANNASQMVWQRYYYLLWGNAVIALLESVLLVIVFKTKPGRTIPLLLIANYISAWLGVLEFGLVDRGGFVFFLFDQPVYQMPIILLTCFVVSFVISVLLEWPCIWWALPWRRRTVWRSLRATLLAQVASYLAIAPLVFATAGLTSSTLRADPSLSFVPGESHAWVYYIGDDDGDVYRIRLDGSGQEFVLTAGLDGRLPKLGLYREEDDEAWELWGADAPGPERSILLIDDVAQSAVPRRDLGGHLIHPSRLSANQFFLISDGRADDASRWTVRSEWQGGLSARRTEEPATELRMAFDTPFNSWQVRCVTVLPGEIVVFEIAHDIVVLALEERTYGVLTRGRGPVVVFDDIRP